MCWKIRIEQAEYLHLFGMTLLQPHLADALLSRTCKDKGEEPPVSVFDFEKLYVSLQTGIAKIRCFEKKQEQPIKSTS